MARRLADAEIGTLLDTSREAGRAILGIYGTEFEVRAKDDASPVTEADVLSESIILPMPRATVRMYRAANSGLSTPSRAPRNSSSGPAN